MKDTIQVHLGKCMTQCCCAKSQEISTSAAHVWSVLSLKLRFDLLWDLK